MRELHILDVPVMSSAEAARQLGMPATTLKQWLEGGSRDGKRYEPVLRPESLGHTNMTWGEVVESQYLRAYRAHVPMQRLRPFIQLMRQEFGVPYPLAHYRPYLGENRSLLVDLQEQADVPGSLLLVMSGRHQGQLLLNPVIEAGFLKRIDFGPDGDRAALRWHPLGKDNPVVLDPELSSGAATVRGIRTEVLSGLVDGGDLIDDVAREFDIDVTLVRAACAYEWQKGKAA